MARHPDGSPVTDAKELQWLQQVDPPRQFPPVGRDGGSSKLGPVPRYLHLWFSHPGSSRISFNEVSFLDADGNPITLGAMGSVSYGEKKPSKLNGNLGWLTSTFSPGTNFPSRVTVRLRYTCGPLERMRDVAADISGSMSLEGGTQLNGIGQNSWGKTFIAIAVDANNMQSRRFDVVAVAKNGGEVLPTGCQKVHTTGGGVDTESYDFDMPLIDVAKFIIGSRPIHTNEWKDVVLP